MDTRTGDHVAAAIFRQTELLDAIRGQLTWIVVLLAVIASIAAFGTLYLMAITYQ